MVKEDLQRKENDFCNKAIQWSATTYNKDMNKEMNIVSFMTADKQLA